MIQYRDRIAREWKLNMVVGQNVEALREKRTFPDGALDRIACCRTLKTEALRNTLSGAWPRWRMNHETGQYEEDPNREPYTGVIVGARADEEGSRSKERYFSPRDKKNEWDVDDQPPELWNYYKTAFAPGTHVRVHPLLDWTELNLWEYIQREGGRQVCISIAARGCATGRWGACRARSACSRRRRMWTKSWRSCARASSPTSRNAAAAPRTRTMAAAWRR